MIDGKRYTFGVSGKLYRRNVLLYDHQSDSLWSQILLKAVTGPLASTPLRIRPLVDTSWRDWKRRHPDTLVLSTETGHLRDYQSDPYRRHAERALGVLAGDPVRVKLYPFKTLARIERFPLQDEVGGRTVFLYFDEGSQRAWATHADGHPAPYFVGYREAWIAFYPQAEIFDAKILE